ncbi:neuropeptide FF receptor 1-like [Ptychodera flava]|uniref:neuropeptide FF receptor 1-like n=1 Tax=Ptychodera flava TaxID=63121 RepID=UPI00396A0774
MEKEDLIFVVFISIFVFVSVALNVVIILVIATNKHMQTVTYVLITNLAVSDLLFAGIVVPQNIHDISHSSDFYEGQFACKLVNFLHLFFIANATYCLVVLSWERYRAIVKATKTQFTMRDCKFLVAGTWALAFAVALPTSIEFEVTWETGHDGNMNVTSLSCSNQDASNTFIVFNTLLVVVATYLLPFILMISNYSRVMMFICHVGRKVKSETGTSPNSTNFVVQRKRLRVVAMLATVTVLYGISWLPYFIVYLLAKLTGNSGSTHNDTAWFQARLALAVFSTMYNFVLYWTFSSQFKEGLKSLVENTRRYFINRPADETPNISISRRDETCS